MIMKKIKKYLSIFIIFLIFLTRVVSPIAVFAEDILETPTPTPTPNETQILNDSTTTTNVDSSADTGNNAINPTPAPTAEPTVIPTDIVDPTITPTPTETPIETPTEILVVDPSPTPIPDSDITLDNSADITNTTSSTAITGENTIIATDSASINPDLTTSTNQDSASLIQTGDAVSVANVENTINTTNINSQVITQTINLFVDKDGSLDLSNPSSLLNNIVTDNPTQPVINVSVVSIDNYTYLTNDISSSANTGQNTINGQGESTIQTGDAYSIVSLLNQINFTIINSTIHLITINIFGNLNGNIILPDSVVPLSSAVVQTENCETCSTNVNVNNDADLSNNLDSTAVTGQNTITGTGSAEITTGTAISEVNNLNIVNSNYFGVNTQALYINNLGNWDGNFVGWGSFDPASGGTDLVLYNISPYGEISCPSCNGGVNITNDATVVNNISSIANTGGNSINGTNGAINTGNAYSVISVFNFINTTFINSLGFFGFINIFGNWTGDIGGESNFAVENPIVEEETESANIPTENLIETDDTSDSNQPRAEGGLLSVKQSNNVGEYVLPGDTVTFFIDTRNIGTGMVYDTILDLTLIKDGQNVGGANFKLGNIGVGRKVKVTTGLVLSETTPGGEYIARAVVRGTVGGENQEVSASADSSFLVWGAEALAASDSNQQAAASRVLGIESGFLDKMPDNNMGILSYLLIADLLAYFSLRMVIGRKKLVFIFTKQLHMKTRLAAIRMILI